MLNFHPESHHSPLGDSTLANLSQRLLDSDLGTSPGKTPFRGARRGIVHSVRVFCALVVSIQPWMAMVACGMFYKVDFLAMATRISHNYQVSEVLLDDGNRIIIPQGNFKFYFIPNNITTCICRFIFLL